MSDPALKINYEKKDDDFFSIEEKLISEYKSLNEKCDSIFDKIKKRKLKNGE